MKRIKALLLVMTTACILGTAAGCADRTDPDNGILDDAVDKVTDDVTEGVDKATDDVTDEIDKVTDEATKDRK